MRSTVLLLSYSHPAQEGYTTYTWTKQRTSQKKTQRYEIFIYDLYDQFSYAYRVHKKKISRQSRRLEGVCRPRCLHNILSLLDYLSSQPILRTALSALTALRLKILLFYNYLFSFLGLCSQYVFCYLIYLEPVFLIFFYQNYSLFF